MTHRDVTSAMADHWKAEHDRVKAQRDQLREALLSATASLAGAESAYRKHAKRHHLHGKADMDPFFSTRMGDFERAVEQARAALRTTEEG